MNQSIIEHKANMYYVEFREDYLLLCQNCTYQKPSKDGKKSKASAYCKALMLAILEHWTNDKRGKGTGLAVFMTHQQWAKAMYGMFSRCVIIDSIDELIGEGLVERAPYKMFGRDTFQYTLRYQEVNMRMRALPDRDPNALEPQVDPSKNRRVASKNRPVASTSRRDPSKSSHNIYSTYIHLSSSENQGGDANDSGDGKMTERDQRVPPPDFSQQEKGLSSPPPPPPTVIGPCPSEEAVKVMDLWDSITGHKQTRPDWVRIAAEDLARVGATQEQITRLYEHLRKSPPKRGINLETISKSWGMLDQLTTHQHQSGTATTSSSPSPQQGRRQMDEQSRRNLEKLRARLAEKTGAQQVSPPPPPSVPEPAGAGAGHMKKGLPHDHDQQQQ